MKRLTFVFAFMLIGCTGVSQNPAFVDISGKVTKGGRPVSDVFLNLQPTGAGGEARLPVKNGEFKGSVMPGKYTWYLSEGANTAVFQAVPDKYRAGSMDRQIQIGSGTSLDLKLD